MRWIGHIIFLVVHTLAALMGCWPLVITIPLHLIYAALVHRRKPGR